MGRLFVETFKRRRRRARPESPADPLAVEAQARAGPCLWTVPHARAGPVSRDAESRPPARRRGGIRASGEFDCRPAATGGCARGATGRGVRPAEDARSAPESGVPRRDPMNTGVVVGELKVAACRNRSRNRTSAGATKIAAQSPPYVGRGRREGAAHCPATQPDSGHGPPPGPSVRRRCSEPSTAINQMPRGPSGDVAPPKASHRPSGVQERLRDWPDVSAESAPGKSSQWSLRHLHALGSQPGPRPAVGGDAKRTNAMKRPSGDHAGRARPGAGLLVKRHGFAGTGQLDVDVDSCPSVGPFQEKATRLPSGERLGARSYPGYRSERHGGRRS